MRYSLPQSGQGDRGCAWPDHRGRRDADHNRETAAHERREVLSRELFRHHEISIGRCDSVSPCTIG
jgi:hypothetical protein